MGTMLGYGGFASLDYWAMFAQTSPFLLRVAVMVVLVYALTSTIAEFCRWHWISMAVYAVGIALILPSLAVMGEYGPAHVGTDVGVLAIPLFGVLLLAKVVVLYRKEQKPQPN